MSSPHDAFFKAGFGRPDVARSELELVLPRALSAALDLDSLVVCPGSFVDDVLRHTHSDLLYTVRTKGGREAFVYVLFEHQASFDATMPLRILRYVMRVWDRWLVDHPKSTMLPLVVPVLLHQGLTGWGAAPELASMLDAEPELLEASRPFVPHFRFVLDDLATLTLDELAARAIPAYGRLVQMAFWSARSQARLVRVAPLLRAVAIGEPDDARTRAMMNQLYEYLLRAAEPEVDVRDVRAILLQIAGPEGYEDLMNAAEQLIEQGRVEGMERGRAEGIERGRVEGLARGRADALRSVIETAVAARGLVLSEVGRARLAACTDVATLDAWVARAITTTSEAEIFS